MNRDARRIPAQSRRLQRTRKPRAIAAASRTEPRRHAVMLRHGFVLSVIAVRPPPTFALGYHGHLLPAACAVGDKAAHGFSGYAGRYSVGSLRSTAHSRAEVNRKRLNITAHYPK